MNKCIRKGIAAALALLLALPLASCGMILKSLAGDAPLTRTDPPYASPVDGARLLNLPEDASQSGSGAGPEAGPAGEWPDNEFTRLLPKPGFGIGYSAVDEDGFAATFTGATVEQLREYVEAVKAAGFTVDAELQDQEVLGMTVFSYRAENADGYSVNIAYYSGTGSLTVDR
jgi:hypothetical protein